jgi:hypothetical protein
MATTVKRVEQALERAGLRGYVGAIRNNYGEVVLWVGGEGRPVYSVQDALRVVKEYVEQDREENPASLPRNRWVSGKLRVTSSGKIQVKVPASALRGGTRTRTKRRRRR